MTTIKREDSKYGGMKWLVSTQSCDGGVSRAWFKTRREAEYEVSKQSNNRGKYTQPLNCGAALEGLVIK